MLATPKATWERLKAAVLKFLPEVRTVLPVTVDTTAPLHAEAAHPEVIAADANDDAEPRPTPPAGGNFICPDCPPTAVRTFITHIALVRAQSVHAGPCTRQRTGIVTQGV